MLNELQFNLIKKAEEKYGDIYPVGGKEEHDQESFIKWDDYTTVFFFDTQDKSTHTVKVIQNFT